MKKLNYILLLTILIFSSCGSDASEDEPEIINTAPNNFSISVSEIQSSKAKITWTKAIDPDGDLVSYTIALNNNVIAQNLSLQVFNLDGLTNETTYTIKITAKDSKGNQTISSETFSTTSLPIPTDFNITIANINFTGATLNWTASSTIENNEITYTILLNNEILLEGTKDLTYELNSLTHNTNYTGEIKAIADNGQIVKKSFEFSTLENTAPEAFELVYAESSGFSAASFSFNEANDPDNDALVYRVIVNDVDVTETLFVSTYSPPTPSYNHKLNNLEGNTDYEVKIKAIDTFDNETYSNAITITTGTTPPDNFEIRVYYVQDAIRLEWDWLTETQYTGGISNGVPVGSVFILDGVSDDLSKALTYNYETRSTAQFNTTLISPNEEHELQIVLDWGANTKKSYSNIVTVNNKIYSPTTVEVDNARIYNATSEFFPLQYTITFKDGLISEFETYEITEIKFHDKVFADYIFFEQGAQNKGYLTYNITQEDFNYLSEFTNGYIEIKDENGYHKIEFQYTIIN